jgi:hypothetical protein
MSWVCHGDGSFGYGTRFELCAEDIFTIAKLHMK